MQIIDVMTPDVQVASPDLSIRDAARIMAMIDAGALPVAADERLVGMITDRDIAIRAVAHGMTPDTKVRDVMTEEVKYCFSDDDVEDVAHNMSDIKVRRLPVLDRGKRLVGIVSLCDIAVTHSPEIAGEAISGIAEAGGPHSQSADGRAAM